MDESASDSRINVHDYMLPEYLPCFQTIELKPGDMLAVRFPRHVLPEEWSELRQQLKQFAPNNPVLILDHTTELSILRKP